MKANKSINKGSSAVKTPKCELWLCLFYQGLITDVEGKFFLVHSVSALEVL